MAFRDMIVELRGSVPKLPVSYAKTLINRSYRVIRERNLWSFLLWEGQWISPSSITGIGTVRVTQGSNIVQLSADAATNLDTQLTAQPYSLITQRQFRVGSGGVYNIWGKTTGGAGYGEGGYGDGGYGGSGGSASLTLDRPYGEFSGQFSNYFIYQCYYAPMMGMLNPTDTNPHPVQDFLGWISVRDMQNFIDLRLEMTRADLDATDPQRSWYMFPTDVVPYKPDINPASATYKCPLFELWGPPQTNWNYQLYGTRRGTDLVLPTDTLPPALGEDVVLALARSYAYEYAETQKGNIPRAVGTDWKFLMGKCLKEYETLVKLYRKEDRETVDNWFSVRRLSLYGKFFAYYNTVGGTAYPGIAFGGGGY